MTEVSPQLDARQAEMLLGEKPLKDFAPDYPDRRALLQAYATGLSEVYASLPASLRCELCDHELPPKAPCLVLEWRTIVKVRWAKILLNVLIMPPLFIVYCILRLDVGNLFAQEFRDILAFRSTHPICRPCAQRYRWRQTGSALATEAYYVMMGVCMVLAVRAAVRALCSWAGWFGFNPADGWAAAGTLLGAIVVFVLAHRAMPHVRRWILVPPQLGRLGKKPFQLARAKLLARDKGHALPPPVQAA